MKQEKTDEELFQEAYNEAKEMGIKDIEDFDVDGFIEYCENLYKMSSKEFKAYFEKNDFEGNVDMQLWYKFLKNKEEE